MNKLIVTDLFIYPIKSTFRIGLEESEVENQGLKNDRNFALINNKNRIITGRENTNLFKIKTQIEKDKLIFTTDKKGNHEFSMLKEEEGEKEVMIFKEQVSVKLFNHQINTWLSKIIEEPCQLVRIDEDKLRKMNSKYNGKENDYIGFKDASAIHLISESSLKELNQNLGESITMHNFRPNIVIKGNEAYEEDTWKRLKIGACEFDVAVKTGRCPMITIDPDTGEKDKTKEPLKTLSKLRREKNKVNFGIYLIPRKLGVIKINDEIVIN